MSKGFEHARRFYGHPDKKDRYEICLRCNHINPILGKFDYIVEVYDRSKKPGKQIINRFGLTPEFWDIALRKECFTFSHHTNIDFLTYNPENDNHWKL
jgi:hypothetical protein